MRNPEHIQAAIDCLRLAHTDTATPKQVVQRAEAYLAFATGDSAAAKLAIIKDALDG